MYRLAKTTYLTLAVLFVSQLKGCSSLYEEERATSFDNSRVYWNVPTSACHKHGIDFKEVSNEFNIKQNPDDKFRGQEITLFYDPGVFPAILRDKEGQMVLRNGGVPQNGDLTKHLKEFKKQVDQHIPDPDYEGLAVIDFESWRPIFRQNWASLDVYRQLSMSIVEQQYPALTSLSEKRRRATEDFETLGRMFMKVTLEVAKDMRPNAKWGYYAFPYCFNYTPKQYSWECDPKVLAENDAMSWLFENEDVILPSVYLRTALNETERIGLMRGRVTEALRIAMKSTPRTKVFVYFWFKYQDESDVFVTREDLMNAIKTINDLGADGYIIWGSSADVNSEEKCQALLDYLKDELGPAILETEQLLLL